MKPFLRISLFLALLAGLLPFSSPVPASAQAGSFDLVLALDSSGSMSETDPAFLRYTAAKLFLSLLDAGDRVGMVTFDDTVTRLTPTLLPLATLQDKTALLDQLVTQPPDGYTDIRAAVADAIALLADAGSSGGTILILSDGNPQLPNGLPAGYEQSTVDMARQAGVRVLGIALTAQGESGLLYRLAAETGGVVIPSRTAAGLVDAFLEALTNLKDRTVLSAGSASAPAGADLPIDPGLAPYIDRATFIAAGPAGVSVELAAPGGERILPGDPRLSFSYDKDPSFTVFTVESPVPGNWRFQLNGSGTVQVRAILRSRLRVSVLEPASYAPQNEPLPLRVRLVEEQPDGSTVTIIGEASFSALITRPDGSQESIDRLYDDGTHGDERAGDGIFSSTYVNTDLPGEYIVQIDGYKGLIPARQSRRVQVIEFPRIAILSPLEARVELRAASLPLEITLQGGDPPALDEGGFMARITSPTGRVTEIDLPAASPTFRAGWTPAEDGLHQIEFVPSGASYKGVPYRLTAGVGVEIARIPALAVLDDSAALGEVELLRLSEGVVVDLHVRSSSSQSETLAFDLIGLPGLRLASVTPAQVPPGESVVHLTLQGQPALGAAAGRVGIAARAGLDMLTAELPLTYTAIDPAVSVSPAALPALTVSERKLGRGARVELELVSQSPRAEEVTLTYAGPQGITAEPLTVSVPAGETVRVKLPLSLAELPDGDYPGQVRLQAGRYTRLNPAALPLTVTIAPPTFMQVWGFPLGGGAVLLLAGLLFAGRTLAALPRPSGRLKVTQAPAGDSLPKEIYLSSLCGPLHRTVELGPRGKVPLSGKDSARILSRRELVSEMVAGRRVSLEKTVDVVQNTGAALTVNGAVVPKGQTSPALKPGHKIRLGGYTFEYQR